MMATMMMLLAATTNIVPASGHGYVSSPRSRNAVAYQDGPAWTADPTPTTPRRDYDPMSLNRGGLCGRNGSVSYSHPPPSYSGPPLPWNSQATYLQDDVVELEVILTAHHSGHVEYRACPLEGPDSVPTQDCFDGHPLTLVEDVSGGLPIDPAHPGRTYLPPRNVMESGVGSPSGLAMRHRYRLPPGLNGRRVLIQWHYVTANTCHDAGYDAYDYPWPRVALPQCDLPLDPCGEVGGRRPEQVRERDEEGKGRGKGE